MDITSNGENGHQEGSRSSKRPRLHEANQVKNKVTVVLGAQWGDEGKTTEAGVGLNVGKLPLNNE